MSEEQSNSIQENYEANQEEIIEASTKITEGLSSLKTGQNLLEASNELSQAEEFFTFMGSITDESMSEKNRMLLSSHLRELNEADITKGIAVFSNNVAKMSQDERYAGIKPALEKIVETSKDLSNSEIYQKYVTATAAFEADDSPEAKKVQGLLRDFNKKIKKIF